MTKLCPAQQTAVDGLVDTLPIGNVFALWGDAGSGKTTVLREIQRTIGGALLTLRELVDAMHSRHPLALEETFQALILDALTTHAHVLVDDLDLICSVTGEGCRAYPRAGLLEAPLTTACVYAAEAGKKLIFAGKGTEAVRHRAYYSGIADFTPADYAFLCQAYLGASAERLDYEKVFRFAPRLNAHQLKAAGVWLRRDVELTTDRFIDYLRSQYLASNVDLGEVQSITLQDLKGVDEVIAALETSIILPLENDELSRTFGLKPKRGVLLAGPPGTGKTSVGRALAHRLKSKFFLMDGTFISGSPHFYYEMQRLVEQAKNNAPSVLFIDDSDAIFESGEELGLYRYLLTMLDGLESVSAGRVCVMLTAMDVGNLPPALLRSGRIELWLEMRLPDADARRAILSDHLGRTAALDGQVDLTRLTESTDGFTGADLKRLTEDGKLLVAADLASARAARPLTDYFLAAIDTVRRNKERYADAEARARKQRPRRPAIFDPAHEPG